MRKRADLTAQNSKSTGHLTWHRLQRGIIVHSHNIITCQKITFAPFSNVLRHNFCMSSSLRIFDTRASQLFNKCVQLALWFHVNRPFNRRISRLYEHHDRRESSKLKISMNCPQYVKFSTQHIFRIQRNSLQCATYVGLLCWKLLHPIFLEQYNHILHRQTALPPRVTVFFSANAEQSC